MKLNNNENSVTIIIIIERGWTLMNWLTENAILNRKTEMTRHTMHRNVYMLNRVS